LKAAWENGACVITYTNNKILAISFIYSMAFDFTVLCLTAWKLASPANGRSKLVGLIFGDGLIYFVIAYVQHPSPSLDSLSLHRFLANLIATIFMLMDLNAVMSIIANVPAAVTSTVCADVASLSSDS
jgi:hypothetical protein